MAKDAELGRWRALTTVVVAAVAHGSVQVLAGVAPGWVVGILAAAAPVGVLWAGAGLRWAVTALAAMWLSTLVAPWYWHGFHWVVYLPLMWALREDTPRENRWLLLLYGAIAEGLIFSWIAETITLFSNIPAVGAMAILALFAVVYGLPYLLTFSMLHPLRRRFGLWWILLLPAWLVAVEHLATYLILFPYQQGISQYRSPWIWQLASVTGVAGLSFLLLAFNAALGELVYRWRERRDPTYVPVGLAVAAVAVVLAFGAWRHGRVEAALAAGDTVRVAQVQSQHDMLWRMKHRSSEAFTYWIDAAKDYDADDVDLVVWPEGACPYDLNDSTAASMLWDVVGTQGFDLIVGAGTRERDPDPEMGERGEIRVFNSTYVFEADRMAPADVPSPQALARELVGGGCDPIAARLWSPWETAAVAAALGPVEEGAPGACRRTLRAHEAALRERMQVTPAFEAMLSASPGAWGRLRRWTTRFEEPPLEELFAGRRGTFFWRLVEAGCEDGDCRQVDVRCQEGGACLVHPEAPHYDKMVPLPFGEYLPLRETFPWLADLIRGPGNFRAGTEPVVFETGGLRYATPICYEGILGYVCDRFEDVDLLVNVTNDAWFGDTAASDLHGMLAASRAIELGVPVFRSAYSGVSFVVEPHGAILHETPLFEDVNRVVDVRLARTPGLYAAFPDAFAWLCALVGTVAVGLAGLAGRRRGAPGADGAQRP